MIKVSYFVLIYNDCFRAIIGFIFLTFFSQPSRHHRKIDTNSNREHAKNLRMRLSDLILPRERVYCPGRKFEWEQTAVDKRDECDFFV
jgi:hypothetical protein